MRALAAILLLALNLSSSLATAQPTVRGSELQLRAPDPELWKTQRRMRLMLAIGTGLAVGSAVHLAWAGRDRYCGYGHMMNNSLYTAGVIGVAGVTLALGGGTGLAAASRHGYLRGTRGQRWIVAGSAVLGAVAATILTTFVWGFDSVGCST